MRRWLWLVLWLSGILFPLAWLRRFSPGYEQAFDALFSPDWMHWMMHAGLFAGLAILVVLSFDLTPSRQVLLRVGLVAVGVGIIQEGLQLISGVQALGWNTCLDLAVDFLGAMIGYGLFAWWRRLRRGHWPVT